MQDVAALIEQRDIFLGAVRRFDALHARNFAHAVRLMNGIVADLGRKEQVAALAPDAARPRSLGKEIGRADDGKLVFMQDKPVCEFAFKNGDVREILQPRRQFAYGERLFRKCVAHLLRPLRRAAPEHDAIPRAPPRLEIGDEIGQRSQISACRRGSERE